MAFSLSFCLLTWQTCSQRQRRLTALPEANFLGNLGKRDFSLNFPANCFVLLLTVVWRKSSRELDQNASF